VPGATRRTEHYDQGYGLTYTVLPASASNQAQHTALLTAIYPQFTSWTRWSVQSQRSQPPAGGQVSTEIIYAYTEPDGSGGSQSGTQTFNIDNPVIPRTRADQLAHLRGDLAGEVDRYSWTFTLQDPGGAVGTSVQARLDCAGRRALVRIDRALTDAAGQHIDPSRTDATHYGSYQPPQPPAQQPPAQQPPAQQPQQP
jgi:hypothetical protein